MLRAFNLGRWAAVLPLGPPHSVTSEGITSHHSPAWSRLGTGTKGRTHGCQPLAAPAWGRRGRERRGGPAARSPSPTVLRSALVFVAGRSQALQMCQPLCRGPVCQLPRHPTPSYHQKAGTAVLCAELPPKASSHLPHAILGGCTKKPQSKGKGGTALSTPDLCAEPGV